MIAGRGCVKFLSMLRKRVVIFIIFSIFSAWNLVFGQEKVTLSEEITILAINKEKVKELVLALGNVEVHYRNIKVFADRAEINTETKDIHAAGNVLIQFPEETISGDEIRFNLDSTEGVLEKGFGMLKPNVFYEAENIERRNADVYSFHDAKMTYCTQPVPRWKFSCSRANIKKNDYMEMWNSVLYIKKIPVFYFPYLRYPLGKERATGFLMPQVGFSGPKGASYSQSFFWAIQRNMDTTFNLDIFAKRGLGGGLEYRYLFSGGVGGQLNLYYFNYKKEQGEAAPSGAYLFRLKHNQPLPFNFNLVADIDYSSSFNFLREFDNDFRRAVVSNRRSEVYLSRAWSYFNLNARVSRFETYFRESDNSVVSYSLPAISFSSSKMKLFSPLYFSFSSSFNRWENGWESEFREGTERHSQSLGFSPQLTFPFTRVPWFTLNSSFSANLNYHFQSYAPGTTEIVDEALFSPNYGLNMELVGPVIYKIYYGTGGAAKLKHIIEPNISYVYESPVASPERIITTWFFYRNHYLRYGLTNRFLIKQDDMPREVFTLGFSQNFYFSPEDSLLNVYRVDGKIPEFSDLSGYLRFYPAGKLSLDVSAAFNPYHKTLSSMRFGANLGSAADMAFLRVDWYKSINPYYEYELYNRHQIGFIGGLKIPELSLEGQAEVDFNIQERELLYMGLSLLYHYQCIDFKGDLKIFYFRDKPEVQFRISFGLGNIGRTVDFLGGAEL